MRVTVKHLRFLVALADKLHFRRAAESVNVTQPTMSAQIRELEEHLGVQLVERNRSRIILTPIGERVVSKARFVLREIEGIINLAQENQSLLDGVIRLGVIPTLGPYLLPHILPELHGNHPRLKLYVREDMPQGLLRDLDDGKLDVLFFPLPVFGAEIETVPLFREPLWLATPADHKLADREVVSRKDLKNEVVLALEHGHRLHEQVHALCEEFEAEVSRDFEGTSLDTLRQMVEMGVGIAFLPSLYVISEIRDSTNFAVRKLNNKAPNRLIGMVWRKHSSRQADYAAFAELIREILRNQPLDAITVT